MIVVGPMKFQHLLAIGVSNAAGMVFGRFDQPYVMPKAADGEKVLTLKVAPKESAPLNPKK